MLLTTAIIAVVADELFARFAGRGTNQVVQQVLLVWGYDGGGDDGEEGRKGGCVLPSARAGRGGARGGGCSLSVCSPTDGRWVARTEAMFSASHAPILDRRSAIVVADMSVGTTARVVTPLPRRETGRAMVFTNLFAGI